jgi:nucleoside-diphosphate-sugar epimerase
VQWHAADLLDENQARRLMQIVAPSHWLHLAWCPTIPGQFWSNLENIHWVRASLGLFEAFEQNGGQRAVFAGTCAEYDWDFGFCRENHTLLRPTTLYGIAKHSLHGLLREWAAQKAISLAWGRVFFLYGPGEHPNKLVASLCRALIKGEIAHCSEGTQRRDFLHVFDAATAFVALLESEAQGAFNVASGQANSVRELAQMLGELTGRGDLLKFGLPSPEAPFVVADVARLRDEIGWMPRYALEAGLRQTLNWWREMNQHDETTH